MVGSINASTTSLATYQSTAAKRAGAASETTTARKPADQDSVEFSKELLKLLDKDGDGKISAEEMSAAASQGPPQGGMPPSGPPPAGGPGSGPPPEIAAALLKGADTDGDGSISASEIATRIDETDTSGDGKLSFNEILTEAKANGFDPSSFGPKGAPPAGGSGGGGGSSDSDNPLDTNHDGVISIDELLAALGGSDDDKQSSSTSASDDSGSDASGSYSIDAKQLASLLGTGS